MRVETEYEVEDSLGDCGVFWLDSSDYPEFVVNTQDECEMELVGGKAFNISRLVRKGFPVPEGFCITTKAYDYFMHFNSISEGDEEISDKIREGVIPPLLAEAICDAYHTYLHDRPCAVRSSSPVEDLKSASFAGQYRSFLNVRGENALLDAVKECWASLWSRSAVEYRKKMGIKSEYTGMAVLVQEMIQAEASGVLFTEDQITVEAVWGLGNILVKGKVVPDHFVVERDEFTVVECTVSHQHIMSLLNPKGGLEMRDTPAHLRDAPVLDDDHIRELCLLGIDVEELFGCPQDIEWALCDGTFTLLQARPITAQQKPIVWSRANIAETLPGYVTYLSRTPENRPDDVYIGLQPLLHCFGIKDVPEDIKFTEYIYGYAYINMTAVHDVLGRIPGLSPEMLDQSLGHTGEEKSESKPGFSAIVKLLPGALRIIRFFLELPKRTKEVIPHSVELIEDIRQKNLQKMSFKELEDLAWEMYERNMRIFQVHSVTALAAMSLFGILQKMVARLGEEGTENLLTIGLEGMSSSKLGVEMWNLACIASKSPRVSELILSRKKDTLEELKRDSDGKVFLRELGKFIEKYGDRCSQELELSVPRWEENPSFVISMVANYLAAPNADPVKTTEEQKRIRLEATDRILKKLKNPIERKLFEKILQKTQQFIVMRENLKTTWMRGLSALRRVYLAVAERLVSTKLLDSRDDIFYLEMTEVSDIIAGTLKKEQFSDRIHERRRERAEYERLDIPEVIVGTPPPIEELKYIAESKERLDGTGCSYGMVTGKARIVFDPRECSEFRKGDILVAPVTDPGWSPLFVIAGGLVMELGGTLSHGVIIAREYGIPAVVGVKNATNIIKTGQLITVDGTKGVVHIQE